MTDPRPVGVRFGRVLRAARSLASFAVAARPASRFAHNDGVPIHYTLDGHGDPVVLIHGFAVTADLNWRLPGITRMLARSFRVISMDLRGHGRSGKPHDDSRYGACMVQDVVRLLDHLSIRRAHVVGYSLGGFVVLKLAAVAPERLRSVSVLGAGWEPPDNSAFLTALPRLAARLEAGKGIGPLMGSFGPNRRKPNLSHRLWVKVMTRYFNDQRALIGVVRSAPELALSEAELRAIRLPVCSIVGSRDPLVVCVEAMKGRLADHSVSVVLGADHVAAPMRPELHSHLRDFLLSHSTPVSTSTVTGT